MSEFTCLLGGAAFSEFQRLKLEQGLSTHIGTRIGRDFQLAAKFIYFIESSQALAGEDLQKLESLLRARRTSQSPNETVLLVVPRFGTQSPWSSKATDIARRCGLRTISRIERGTLLRLPAEAFNSRNKAAIGRASCRERV